MWFEVVTCFQSSDNSEMLKVNNRSLYAHSHVCSWSRMFWTALTKWETLTAQSSCLHRASLVSKTLFIVPTDW